MAQKNSEPPNFSLPAALSEELFAAEEARTGRDILIMSGGGLHFAIFADEAESVSVFRQPTPLPYAPAAVLGVIGVKGRMITVLDLVDLLGQRTSTERNFLVELKGDEQLGLAVERAERIIVVQPEDIDISKQAGLIYGVVMVDSEPVPIIDTSKLFDEAVRGIDRRRPRTQ
jgi:chemotaxis signal transduction protein